MDLRLALDLIIGAAALGNFIVLLQIKLEMSRLELHMRDWVREQFADRHETEMRLQQTEEGLERVVGEMHRLWEQCKRSGC